MNVQKEFNMNTEHIKGLICSALEGGSNYWYMIEKHNRKEVNVEYTHEVPFEKDGYLLISDVEDELKEHKKITFDDIMKGYDTFASNLQYKRHYTNFINENDDAETGDVFFQLVVFGEVIYG